jgi:hypothetical protein
VSLIAEANQNVGTGTNKWYGGALDGDFAYFAPRAIGQGVGKLDTRDGTWSTFTAAAGSQGGVALGGDGYLYSCGGSGANSACLKIDGAGETSSTLGAAVGNGQFRDAVAGSNGDVYLIPGNATTVSKIDVSAGTRGTFGTVAAGNNKYYTGVLVGDDIYCIPLAALSVLKIDTTADTLSTFTTADVNVAGNKWWGAVLVGTDIYCVPWSATRVLKIDTTTDTTSLIGSTYGAGGKWSGAAVLGSHVVGTVDQGTTYLAIDTTTDTTETFGTSSGSNRYYGPPVTGSDGLAVWAAPTNDPALRKIYRAGGWSVGFVSY